jgi:copper(I)-binding protein
MARAAAAGRWLFSGAFAGKGNPVTALTGRVRHSLPADLARAAAGPLICVIALTGLLSAWVIGGGAGTLTRVRLQITQAAVPMRGFTANSAAGPATTFLTIRNLTGTPDELIAVTSPDAGRVQLTVRSGAAASRAVVSDLVIPARSALTLTPFGDDIILEDPAPYEDRSSVRLTLTFRHSGTVTIDAAVTAPGTP